MPKQLPKPSASPSTRSQVADTPRLTMLEIDVKNIYSLKHLQGMNEQIHKEREQVESASLEVELSIQEYEKTKSTIGGIMSKLKDGNQAAVFPLFPGIIQSGRSRKALALEHLIACQRCVKELELFYRHAMETKMTEKRSIPKPLIVHGEERPEADIEVLKRWALQ
jgi:hypothetical protein